MKVIIEIDEDDAILLSALATQESVNAKHNAWRDRSLTYMRLAAIVQNAILHARKREASNA